MIAWGLNIGQWAVKNTITSKAGVPVSLKPFPAVIAPAGQSDDLGLGAKRKVLTGCVDGIQYIGGTAAERHPLANRQMANGRLDETSPLYRALVQMSLQHIQADRRIGSLTGSSLVIATALPVSWRGPDADDALEGHVRAGLKKLAEVRTVYVRSEPAAVIYHELLDDTGGIRQEQAALAKGLVCVGDIGGATLNRSVLDGLETVQGQSDSPLLGSRQAIEQLAQQRGIQLVDAERMLQTAAQMHGTDHTADAVLRQYSDAVVAELERAWAPYRKSATAFLFAGGTTLWLGPDLLRVFGIKARVVANPQQAIATGLHRYARRQISRQAKDTKDAG